MNYSKILINSTELMESQFNVELAMEGYIADNPNILKLKEDDEVEVKGLQKSLIKNDGAGRIDILASYKDGFAAIVELKKGDIDEKAFNQLKTYFSGNYKENEKYLDKKAEGIKWIGLLVGTGIEKNFYKKILGGVDCQDLGGGIPYAIMTLRRYKNEDQMIVLSEVIYELKKGSRDYSRWSINKEGKYSKCKVPVNLIQKYKELHPDVTKNKIDDFFKSIDFQNGIPLLYPIDEFEDHENKRQYYAKRKGKLIEVTLGGIQYAVTDWWWTIAEMKKLEKVAEDMGLPIKKESD